MTAGNPMSGSMLSLLLCLTGCGKQVIEIPEETADKAKPVVDAMLARQK